MLVHHPDLCSVSPWPENPHARTTRPLSPVPEALEFFSGSPTSCSCKQGVVEGPPPQGDGVREPGTEVLLLSLTPALFDRLGQQHQPAQVIFNHMITQGLLSLTRFNWSCSTPTAELLEDTSAGRAWQQQTEGACPRSQPLPQGCSRHPKPVWARSADGREQSPSTEGKVLEDLQVRASEDHMETSHSLRLF